MSSGCPLWFQINDNAKIEAGRLRLDYKRWMSRRDVVDEVVRSTKRQVEDKHQNIELSFRPAYHRSGRSHPCWTSADEPRKQRPQIHAEGGKLMLGAETTHNQWDPEGAKQVVHLWVKDNGIGISIEDQAKIFQRFFRSDDMKAREVPGTGLGLNITKSLVEMQGGRIWFDRSSERGQLSTSLFRAAEG
jgi:signal transduction histidine kinase